MLIRLARIVLWLLAAVLFFAAVTNLWVVLTTADQIILAKDLNDKEQTALILGTSYQTVEGTSNPFFTSRMSTGIALYEENLVGDFILSGSATMYYNEPKAMARSLQDANIPESVLTFDTLGVRTLASIVRCKEVYKKEKVIIITQKFHAYRALFISNYYELEAVAIPTDDVNSNGKAGIILREFFARPLAVIDLYILNSRP